MKPKEKTRLEFAGYCFIHKPELANDLNTLIAGFINKPKEQIEELFCYHKGAYTLNEDGTCCKCHRLPKP